MNDVTDRARRTGEPVWVLGDDGSLRPAEFVGEATSGCRAGQGKALVIYVDAPGHGVVVVDHLRRREHTDSGGRAEPSIQAT